MYNALGATIENMFNLYLFCHFPHPPDDESRLVPHLRRRVQDGRDEQLVDVLERLQEEVVVAGAGAGEADVAAACEDNQEKKSLRIEF